MQQKKRPETYRANVKGKKVRLPVPAAIDEADLFATLQDNFSPQAIATMAAYLQVVNTNNHEVNRQLAWFTDQLIGLLGEKQYNDLGEEVGL